MSKVSDAKAVQGYRETPDTCSSCRYFRSTLRAEAYGPRTLLKESGLRCILGGFKVKKMAVCDKHERQEDE